MSHEKPDTQALEASCVCVEEASYAVEEKSPLPRPGSPHSRMCVCVCVQEEGKSGVCTSPNQPRKLSVYADAVSELRAASCWNVVYARYAGFTPCCTFSGAPSLKKRSSVSPSKLTFLLHVASLEHFSIDVFLFPTLLEPLPSTATLQALIFTQQDLKTEKRFSISLLCVEN